MGTKLYSNNLNVVFVGGTGILFIMDYLARFVMHNCDVNNDMKSEYFGRNY